MSLASERVSERNVRRQQVRGLVWIALGVILLSVVRAGVHRVFGVGWWRLW